MKKEYTFVKTLEEVMAHDGPLVIEYIIQPEKSGEVDVEWALHSPSKDLKSCVFIVDIEGATFYEKALYNKWCNGGWRCWTQWPNYWYQRKWPWDTAER